MFKEISVCKPLCVSGTSNCDNRIFHFASQFRTDNGSSTTSFVVRDSAGGRRSVAVSLLGEFNRKYNRRQENRRRDREKQHQILAGHLLLSERRDKRVRLQHQELRQEMLSERFRVHERYVRVSIRSSSGSVGRSRGYKIRGEPFRESIPCHFRPLLRKRQIQTLSRLSRRRVLLPNERNFVCTRSCTSTHQRTRRILCR